MPGLPVVVAHRGLHHAHPENSLAALLAAWSTGTEWCECDVRSTANLTPVLLHDDTLDRTTTGTGPVFETTDAALAKARLCAPGSRMPGAEGVPRLADVLRHKPPAGKLLVEIKPADLGATVRHALSLLDPATCVLQSFNEENLIEARRLAPTFPLAWLIETVHDPLEVLERPWPAVHCHFSLLTDRAVVDRIHAAGKTVGVWTVNDEPDLRRCIELGVDVVITDELELAQRLVAERAG